MKQAQYSPMQVSEMAISLFAVNKGYFDDIDVKRVLAFESALLQYVKQKSAKLVETIESKKDLDADGEKQLDSIVQEFKKSWA
jgi:F-type H+-transporting ATPase subunit alpha